MSDGSPINIETRRRTGHGYTREQLPAKAEAAEEIPPIPAEKPPVVETKPGVREPVGQKPLLPEVAVIADVLKRIEASNATPEDWAWLKTVTFANDDDKDTAVSVFKARMKQVQAASQSAPFDVADGARAKGADSVQTSATPLNNSPQSPDIPAAEIQEGAHTGAPAPTAEKTEDVWI